MVRNAKYEIHIKSTFISCIVAIICTLYFVFIFYIYILHNHSDCDLLQEVRCMWHYAGIKKFII